MNKFVVYSGNNPDVIRDALLKRGNWEQDNVGMCTKTGLIKTLRQYYLFSEEASIFQSTILIYETSSGIAKYQIWDTTPTSYIISAGNDDIEFQQLVTKVKELSRRVFQRESVPAKHCLENMWLVKPANLNQGRGIEVFRSLPNILHFLNMKPNNSQWVVQKYVEKPLLYYKRKFDIRVWVLITHKNEIFFYKHGYMRTSSSSYDTKEQNNYVHLTNNCLQQHGDNYGAFEEGNTLSFKTLEDFLRQEYPKYDINLETHIVSRFKDFIIDSYLAWKKQLNPYKRKNVFELFGYDFLIDEDLRVWLIEINTNPYLGVPNPFIADLLPKMVDDMLEITLDPIFLPKNPVRADSRPNDFELIYGEGGTAYSPKPINVRSSYNRSPYPVIELDPSSRIVEYPENQEIKSFFETDVPDRSRTVSLDGKQQALKNSTILFENVIKNLKSPMFFRSALDSDFLGVQIARINSSLLMWNQLSPRDVELACKALIVFSTSPASVILAEQRNILNMSQLLSIRDVKPEIKITVVIFNMASIEAYNNLIKDPVIKKKILCNKLIHDLINIAISSCDEKECTKKTYDLRLAALHGLGNVGGMTKKKTYIPGESRENEKIRHFFISQGGLLAMLIISKKGLEEEVRKTAEKCLLNSVEFSDWQQQTTVLQSFKQFQDEKKRNLITDFVRELKSLAITPGVENSELQNPILNKQENQPLPQGESNGKDSTGKDLTAQNTEIISGEPNNTNQLQAEVNQTEEQSKQNAEEQEEMKAQQEKQELDNQNHIHENPNQANFEEIKSIKPEDGNAEGTQKDPKLEALPNPKDDFIIVTAQIHDLDTNQQSLKNSVVVEHIQTEFSDVRIPPQDTKIEEPTRINLEPKSVTRDYFIFYRTGHILINTEKFFQQMITLPQ